MQTSIGSLDELECWKMHLQGQLQRKILNPEEFEKGLCKDLENLERLIGLHHLQLGDHGRTSTHQADQDLRSFNREK